MRLVADETGAAAETHRSGYAPGVSISEIHPPTSVRVGKTSIGRGVIATADIATGETIEVCPVLHLGPGEIDEPLGSYIVALEDDDEGSVLMLGYGSLYNSSMDPNARYVLLEDDAYAFEAIRDIAAGEQVTIDYGEEWWETRDLERLEI
jgi:hypothetical protein